MKFILHSFRCLAATLAVAGVLRETTAQETLTIEYTTRANIWSDPAVHFVEVEKDIRQLGGRSSVHIPVQHRSIMTTLILPEGMSSLEDLDLLFFRRNAVGSLPGILTHLVLPEVMPSLKILRLGGTSLTNIVLPKSMPSLETLELYGHVSLTNIVLPEGLTSLERLRLDGNWLTNIAWPKGLTSLEQLNLGRNWLTNLTLPEGLMSLRGLTLPSVAESLRVSAGMDLDFFRVGRFTAGGTLNMLHVGWWIENGELQNPPFRIEFYEPKPSPPAQGTLTIEYQNSVGKWHSLPVEKDIQELDLSYRTLTSITLPQGLTSLRELDLSRHRLTNLTLPEGLTSLETLNLSWNQQLTNLTLPEGLTSLRTLDLTRNPLTNLTLPNSMPNLETLNLSWNSLTTLTLPQGLTSLRTLDLSENSRLKLLRVPAEMNIDHLDIPRHTRIERYDPSLPPSPPRLSYRRLENGLELSWEGGTLQSDPTITGPWQDVGSSGGAFKLFSSSPAEFFRVIKP